MVVPSFTALVHALEVAAQQLGSVRPPLGQTDLHQRMTVAMASVSATAAEMLSCASLGDLGGMERATAKYESAMDALIQTGQDLRLS